MEINGLPRKLARRRRNEIIARSATVTLGAESRKPPNSITLGGNWRVASGMRLLVATSELRPINPDIPRARRWKSTRRRLTLPNGKPNRLLSKRGLRAKHGVRCSRPMGSVVSRPACWLKACASSCLVGIHNSQQRWCYEYPPKWPDNSEDNGD